MGASSVGTRVGRGVGALVAVVVAAVMFVASPLTSPAAHAASEPGTFSAVTPARLLDTRNGTGAPQHTVAGGASVPLTVTGRGGVPASGVAAVVLNVTVTRAAGPGHLTVYPSGANLPTASNVNFVAGQTIANAVTVKVGSGGRVILHNGSASPVHLIADVAGWYAAGTAAASGALTPLDPARLLDTRNGTGAPQQTVAGGKSVTFQVSGRGGVPGGGTGAAVFNVTVTRTSAAGHITAYPAGGTVPTASNLNFTAGQTVANAVTVKLSNDGRVTLHNGSTAPVHLIADVAGWFVAGNVTKAGGFSALAPSRVLDTRNGTGAPQAAVQGGASVTLDIAGRGGVSATNAAAVALNVTAVRPTGAGHLTVYPDGGSVPTASNLNFTAGRTVPNQVTVGLSGNGKITLTNGSAQPVHLIADVAGWYAAADTGTAPPASVTATGDVSLGGTITLVGRGWVHPNGGGSTVAMKIDRGNIRKVTPNTDVWVVIPAASDGTFRVDFRLPDGTTGSGGSSPALAAGPHVLNFLSGSLSPGDAVRSVPTNLEVAP